MSYQEDNLQAGWIDTHEAKPYTVRRAWFIDDGDVTVARASSLIQAKAMRDKNYPGCKLRCYNPTQEEYGQELKQARITRKINWGVIPCQL